MLTTLFIKNYALIDELTVEFEQGLNIITGETGAGKSIIIGALSLVLGERADSDAVRKGADKAIVEAFFNVAGNKKLKQLLEEHQIEFSHELILRREVSSKGQSRSFINDTPSTITLLKQVGDLLVDLHGQHEHQSLLRTETHIDLLDDFGGLERLVLEFGEAYAKAHQLIERINDLRSREQQLRERQALYEFQLKEIDQVNPQPGEEEALETELKILENAERLYSVTERLYQMLYEGDNAIHDQLVLARNELEDITTIDKSFEEPKNEAASAAVIVDELAKFIQGYNSKIEFHPERLEEIRDRLGQLSLLKKKYGGSIEAVLSHRENIGKEVALAENFEAEITKLQQQLNDERRSASTLAQRLSGKRHDVARKINASIEKELGNLGITQPTFEVKITLRQIPLNDHAIVKLGKEWYETTPKGIDGVEFYVSTNIGEDPKPLVKVASGGEISRIMLALKMILAKSDRLPLLVFDEIDVGVSGRIAHTVGQSLKKLSQFHQVIAITHLPQIASLADTHFVVEKMQQRERTVTSMRKLSIEDRVSEVAKLLSAEEVTDVGLESARELMGLK